MNKIFLKDSKIKKQKSNNPKNQMFKQIMANIIAIVLLIILYDFISYNINNDIIVPKISVVFEKLVELLTSTLIYQHIFDSLLRLIISSLISISLAFILAIIGFYYSFLELIIKNFIIFIKAIPNITIIVILLMWFSRNNVVIIVPLLITLPLVYDGLVEGYEAIERSYREVALLYNHGFWFDFWKVYLPLMKVPVSIALTNVYTLGFKVVVMAEIIGQVKSGLGSMIYYYKANLEMAYVLAYTIIIIMILFILDKIGLIIKRRVDKNGY